VIAGGGGKITTAFDRVELMSDALTAILAAKAGFTVVTEDADFDVRSQLVAGLQVLFYDRKTRIRKCSPDQTFRTISRYPSALTVARHPGPISVDVSSSATIAGPRIVAHGLRPARS
jgi:hypothetical protein